VQKTTDAAVTKNRLKPVHVFGNNVPETVASTVRNGSARSRLDIVNSFTIC